MPGKPARITLLLEKGLEPLRPVGMPARQRRPVLDDVAGRPGNALLVGGAVDIIVRAQDVEKVVLAYSGGLDTSIILKWLQTEFGAEVVTFTADLGQGEELEPARKKALAAGVKPENIFIEDVREDFVRDYVFPMFRANAVYEGVYLLGTSIARPLIAKRQIEIADMVGADAVCHGATGKGNDQVRFELGYYGLNPDIKVIAPWRDWDFKSRTDLLKFAESHGIEIAKDKRGEAPFSVDANLLHSSSEGKVLEDPAQPAPEFVHMRTISPEEAPDEPEIITIGFEKGDACSINGEEMSPPRCSPPSTPMARSTASAGWTFWKTALSA
jgi:argininosuccinate synthase